jgi:hypothetical protein
MKRERYQENEILSKINKKRKKYGMRKKHIKKELHEEVNKKNLQ